MRIWNFLLAASALLVCAQPACAIEEPPSWHVYTSANSDLPANLVYNIAIDKLGRAWMSCGGLTLFNGSSWKNFSEYSPVQIAIDKDNNAWSACSLFSGSLVFSDGSVAVSYTDQNSGIPSNWVTGVAVDNYNHVWAGCNYTGVGEYDGVSWVKHLSASETGGGRLGMACSSDNTVWMISADSLYSYSNGVWVSTAVPGFKLGTTNMLSDLLCAGDGSVWLGTSFNGVGHYKDGAWTFYSVAQGMPDTTVLSIALDSAGVLWVGTTKGLTSFDGSTWSTRTTENWVLPSNRVQSLAVGANNQLWVGTDKGLLVASQTATSVGEYKAPVALSVAPNPIDASAAVRFTLPVAAYTTVELFTATGQRVATLTAGELSAGEHTYVFSSHGLAAGAYQCVVRTGNILSSQTSFIVRR